MLDSMPSNHSDVISIHADDECGDPTDCGSAHVRTVFAQLTPLRGCTQDTDYRRGREAVRGLAYALENENTEYAWSPKQCAAVAAAFAQSSGKLDEDGQCGWVIVMEFLAEQIRR